jgi:protein-S-isoprenylcysteine O-methyltransferase Ste14
MESYPAGASPGGVADGSPVDRPGIWSRVAAYLVRRRVRITVIVFVLLMAEDVLTGVRPHSLINYRDPESDFGLVLIALGLGIRTWAAGVLHKTRELTTTGPYALIRNPLYVGSFLIMAGFAALIGDVKNIVVILGPLAGLYLLQVLHEERVLSSIYGDRWRDYAAQTPRIFPRRAPNPSTLFSTWSLNDWLGSREYRAMSAVFAGLLMVELWRRWRA